MDGENETIRVLVADDHPVMRDGLRAAIESAADLAVVGEAVDGAEALARFRELLPDVILLDLQMPQMDGLQAIAAIRGEFPAARIVVLTTYPGDVRAKQALALGATAYLLKTSTRAEILGALRAAAAGRRVIASEVASEVASHAASEMLTPRELSVLGLVASGHSNKRIGELLCISEDTVKARLKNVLAKLGASDRTHAVTIALRRGFLAS
ncbi:response regulator transcription factor [Tahibacter harae]|uniref:Response regulator transcription factor n=1 Tax=Tahibacter harae TaxID=2963937 RepID=A0ABT1QN20_9GAMM|nr:response regulator transcription factor [Tahibacter harae]MCQ4163822.1 response regulator transcription factor [Tahibacter harae]